MPTWEDNRSLVFAALGDLGMAQQVHVAASDNGVKYTRTDPVERDWIAPELIDEKIRELARTGIKIRPVNEYNKATDVYALDVLTQKDYLNSGRENMAYGNAFVQMRQQGLLP
ncbi:hypothetical protein R1sor_022723 [Riccia sorocarpa]|uniref:Uncharacterized protein n=1 Tax=Riccia sorocarpa TaxID=122646 RepID=A0ABD3GMP3_9MARC